MGGPIIRCFLCSLLLVLVASCGLGKGKHAGDAAADPCAVALAKHHGPENIDKEISRLQEQAREAPTVRVLERLGWMFVSKARLSYDPGYYKIAEQCAECMESKSPGNPESLLLRGHVLHNLHRFKEAEKLAHKLVAMRGLAFDYGLLGDVLMEQGRLMEAADAYQEMVDLKPCLQSYSRAAHMRWLKGDLEGAIELMRMAASAGSPMDSESTAWAYSRLALYELQAGDLKKALLACNAALRFQSDYAAALLVRGRILLAQGKSREAIEPLRHAATFNPLPEYEWALAEALRASGNVQEASAVEKQLAQRGHVSDPRTFALYLANRGEQVETALRLAEEELATRTDVFTYDAIAWALAAAGKFDKARSSIDLALAHGTKDARLFYHAGVIAAAAGKKAEARRWLDKAAAMQQMLLPSEREQLSKQVSAL